MQEYWFCSRCKSMNRAAASSCYSCRAPREAFTLARHVERTEGPVLTPGLDEEHRAVAWTLMARQTYVSAWRLGYLAAFMLLLMIPIFAAFLLISARAALDSADTSQIIASSFASPVLVVSAVIVVVTIVVHSAFLGLASMNAPALGCGSPRFNALRAAGWWIESYLWARRAGIAFVVPPAIAFASLLNGGLVFGLVIGIVWMLCAYAILGDPITSLSKPARLLADLYVRSGVQGSPDSRIVSWWALAWGTAQGIVYAAGALLYLLVVVVLFAIVAGVDTGPSGSGGNSNLAEAMLLIGLGACQAVAESISLVLLAIITYDIATRQRMREEWVRSGAQGPQPAQ